MSRAIKFGCRNFMVAKKPAQYVPEPASRRLESSYQSNRWVATIPLTEEEEDSLKISEENRMLTISSNFWARSWTHELPLPEDAISDTINARTNRGMLYISAQLEDPYISGKEIPISKTI